MMRNQLLFSIALCVPLFVGGTAAADQPYRTISITASDGLAITADLYLAHKDPQTPFIVLFHQAGWSRGEYREIAPRLNELGFNCMAVDQRSGGSVNGVDNQTHTRAKKAKKGTTYVDALDDMRASLRYAREHHGKGKLIAWGSSYSSALVVRLAGTEPDLADASLAFSPGEYFAKLGKSKTWIGEAASKIDKPLFITSARREHDSWKDIYAAVASPHKWSYLPESKGNHGSRALWEKFSDSPDYWRAVTAFLALHGAR